MGAGVTIATAYDVARRRCAGTRPLPLPLSSSLALRRTIGLQSLPLWPATPSVPPFLTLPPLSPPPGAGTCILGALPTDVTGAPALTASRRLQPGWAPLFAAVAAVAADARDTRQHRSAVGHDQAGKGHCHYRFLGATTEVSTDAEPVAATGTPDPLAVATRHRHRSRARRPLLRVVDRRRPPIDLQSWLVTLNHSAPHHRLTCWVPSRELLPLSCLHHVSLFHVSESFPSSLENRFGWMSSKSGGDGAFTEYTRRLKGPVDSAHSLDLF